MKIAVIAAHPDDEVLGCGGTIARLAKTHDVHVMILGEGVTSRYPDRDTASAEEVKRLRTEVLAATGLLGARGVEFCGLPDNRFDELPLLEVVRRVEPWLERIRPEAVYTHHPGDLNIDHQFTFRAVLTATRPTPGCSVSDVYAFEVPSSTEWAFQRLQPPFCPSVFVDISSTIDAKVQAMQCYTGETRPAPHPRSPETLRAIARRWGSTVGVEYAEVFELVRSVR